MILHNKYFKILKEFTGDYDRQIYGREVYKKIGLTQKNTALALSSLQEKGILKSKKLGTTLFYCLNKEYFFIKEILSQIELQKKIELMEKYPKLAFIFKESQNIIGIFGSYAKGMEKKNSDLDVFIIGNKPEKDYVQEGRNYDYNISVKNFTSKEFISMLEVKNTLALEMQKNHVLLTKTEDYLQILWRHLYGNN